MATHVFSKGHFEHRSTQPCDVCVIGEERHHTPSPLESGRGLVLPPIEADHVQPLPIVQAYADKMGVVEVLQQVVPTAMAIAPGPMVLGMLLATLSGRSPLYRLEECLARHDTAMRLGQAIAPGVCEDDPVGRVVARL